MRLVAGSNASRRFKTDAFFFFLSPNNEFNLLLDCNLFAMNNQLILQFWKLNLMTNLLSACVD